MTYLSYSFVNSANYLFQFSLCSDSSQHHSAFEFSIVGFDKSLPDPVFSFAGLELVACRGPTHFEFPWQVVRAGHSSVCCQMNESGRTSTTKNSWERSESGMKKLT